MFLNVLLRPFMPAVLALVRILKFSPVNNHRRAFHQSKVGHHDASEIARVAHTHNFLRSMFFYIFPNKMFAHELDMEYASTPWTVSEEFHS
jgi:hypothetical protein